jgi:hypothetical protein
MTSCADDPPLARTYLICLRRVQLDIEAYAATSSACVTGEESDFIRGAIEIAAAARETIEASSSRSRALANNAGSRRTVNPQLGRKRHVLEFD